MPNLKIIIFSFIIASSLFGQIDPVIMTVNGEKILKSEFLSVYLKNNNDPKYDKESLNEYMELYKKFKLKVAEAEFLGYGKKEELIKELEGYRKTLSRPYLVDSAKNESLIQEAYERSKFEIRASHILIQVGEDANPADTLKAYNRIMGLKKRILAGEPFEKVATGKDGSEDPSVSSNKGDLGYFTAFQMVYPFENMAYQTKKGEIGGPVRTRFGYHLIDVTDIRPARGTMNSAHIMVAVRRDSDPTDIENAEKKINEIYNKLSKGEDFSNLVRLYSDDNGSKDKGGRLPQFGTGTNQRMVSEYEDAAFALLNDNDFSKPFRTDYGFHIVKRIDYTPLGSYEEMYKGLQSKVNKGERGQLTQDFFLAKLKRENNFKDYSAKNLKWFFENVDSTIFMGKWQSPELKKNKTLFVYKGIMITQNDFKAYLESSQKRIRPGKTKEFISEKYKSWVDQYIINNEESTLESKYPDFKALMKEYHDGVLLYEIMKDKVWDIAVKDSSGLRIFFEKYQSNYMWPDRIDAEVFSTEQEIYANTAFEMLNKNVPSVKVLDSINANSQLNIKLEKGKFPTNEMAFSNVTTLNEGINPIFKLEDQYYVIKINKKIDSAPKTFAESRGNVIQDYQKSVEDTWINELKEKYPIEVNLEVLYNLENSAN